ncbi:phosphoglycerate dehydrogenase [bacterium (Candidatus Blackallbacteria) CG17_big_fil_post_rev_8_21_14_2_50_48_46]|uniref:D-3-phosphoglycerate dehydrogenase n=1 Tax=bacterium (Candidatus Blackallbacteria) CG17_big_fil_post_rev_8_21_14_2_50_48_46 TaxID=2014261 RepID=A0A2M7GCF5_9BACT|nr:MAG: phosphoglycerate dehydrogenase [bacterium (Candidatus Blackallbacteria) CG18_big_fil_WC_8_21_14_2_50_49_26]PIW19653.1 MAG: phosphoglycerate dehydrogenase [bacterium (Candidatus Blackallbacteria) CG17_big_fil_post_rev_8_21_14_2_50_48_46]PIW44724.1 MAG: phosphoglycerate dehydrogenase [bacterium (Candidatus Blackallbacteria) CG13_big_fil_rev_8_21_14_2_50_49_14]
MTARVLVCDHIHSSAVEILRPLAEITEVGPLSEAELCAQIGQYDALLVRSQTKVSAKALEAAAGKLKIIARAGVGVDNIDVPAATQYGIVVVNSPEGNTIAAAEHTLGLMMALSRSIPAADASLKQNEWRRKDFTGNELYGKTLGIVGLGKIGSHVARVAKSLGMHLVGYDPFINAERAAQLEVEVVDLPSLYQAADVITLHVPKTPETFHMINEQTLAKMKTGVRIINCARGELIDTPALIAALESGKVGGAALDVFEQEPLKDSPLQALGHKVVLTPHLGASTEEAQINVALDVAEQVAAVLRGEQAQNAINIPSLMPHLMQEVRPFFPLAEKLGSFIGQLQSCAIREVRITYFGELAEKPTAPLKVAVMHGLLSPTLKERVNYVNVLLLAKERGIAITEAKASESHDYANLIQVEVNFSEGTRKVAGSILGEKQERIVNIDGFPLSCVPQGCLLVLPHPDKPGMVGMVGEFLGQNDINISGIQLGRQTRRGAAVMVINIDEALSPELLQKLQAREEFCDTRMVVFS